MNKITPTFKVLALAAAFAVLAGCNTISRDSESSSMIIIQSLTGTTIEGETVAYLQSDVVDSDGLVRVNNATANIIVRLVNPDPINGSSQFNDVVLTGYRVTYELMTGAGSPGVDVPMPFDGTFSTVLCPVDETTSIPFVVVLEAAKHVRPARRPGRDYDGPRAQGQDRDLRPRSDRPPGDRDRLSDDLFRGLSRELTRPLPGPSHRPHGARPSGRAPFL